MIKVSWAIFIYLFRPVSIRQDEVEVSTTLIILPVVFKADELNYRTRLEPLLKERGFIEKLKQGSAVFIW